MSNDRAVGGLPNQEFNSFTSGKNYLFAIGISSYQKFHFYFSGATTIISAIFVAIQLL